jgi:hypothetical protein
VFAVGGDVEWEQGQVVADVFDAFSHEALDRKDGVLGRFDHFLLGAIPDELGPSFVKVNNGRYELVPVCAGNDPRHAVFDDGDEAIRRSQIESNNLGHASFPFPEGSGLDSHLTRI